MKDEIKKYLEAQEKWLKETGVTIGSKVLVTGSCPSQSCGWNADWAPRMDECIGQTVEVTGIYRGESTSHDDDGLPIGGIATTPWNFPFFVLVKVEE
jgi:hypothetical protein